MSDDRKLTGSGFYKFDVKDMDTYAFDEFELEDDLEETVRANQNKNELNEVVDNYKRILSESLKGKVDDYQELINRVDAVRKSQAQEEESKKPVTNTTNSVAAMQMT